MEHLHQGVLKYQNQTYPNRTDLLTYPFIKQAYAKNDLEIFGWPDHFSSGEISQKFNMRELFDQGEN